MALRRTNFGEMRRLFSWAFRQLEIEEGSRSSFNPGDTLAEILEKVEPYKLVELEGLLSKYLRTNYGIIQTVDLGSYLLHTDINLQAYANQIFSEKKQAGVQNLSQQEILWQLSSIAEKSLGVKIQASQDIRELRIESVSILGFICQVENALLEGDSLTVEEMARVTTTREIAEVVFEKRRAKIE